MVQSEKQQSTNNLEIDEVEKFQSRGGIGFETVPGSDDALYDDVLSSDMFASGETNLLQWFLALDLQVMGACRADERLKPLLKLNVSGWCCWKIDCSLILAKTSSHQKLECSPGACAFHSFQCAWGRSSSGRSCAQLLQGGILTCGGTVKHLSVVLYQLLLLCHCSIASSDNLATYGTFVSLPEWRWENRGNLNLAILPTSDLRISFIGDDGSTERVGTFCSESDCSAIEIKDIVADESGRFFLISLMVRLSTFGVQRSLSSLEMSCGESGIDESRIDCFAIHLRAYLHGSAAINPQSSSMLSRDPSIAGSVDSAELGVDAQISAASQKPLQSEHVSSLGSNASLMDSLRSYV
ncbi:hypothetical protein HAX54_018423 [Datura stramonium]|uniref:Uncharacterized protein n=1 Tax=Datura stramonium TaxID=4076 RepID=A0ABS8S1A1_DATST|nr:hypothetical protein [Datura stramonium]